MATINGATGKLISGRAEIFQSIQCIFDTPKGTRIMRRLFGADRVKIVDKGLSPMNLVDFYAEIASALSAEPRFRMSNVALSADSKPNEGRAVFDLKGVFYPRGHLGDFSQAETVKGSFVYNDPDTPAAG